MPDWVLAFDGLYEPRSSGRGIATFGFVVRHGDGRVHAQSGLVAPPGPLASANVAEFGALIEGLTWLRDRAPSREPACALRVIGDSRLVIETVAGRWKLHGETLLPLRDLAQRLAQELGVASFEKVPRERNDEADKLSREAYHREAAAHPEWELRASR